MIMLSMKRNFAPIFAVLTVMASLTGITPAIKCEYQEQRLSCYRDVRFPRGPKDD